MRRLVLVAVGVVLLAGCSERVIASANEDVLIVVENIDLKPALPTADLHYVLARPQPVSDEPEDAAALVSGMRYEATFDCAAGAWGSRVHELVMADGSTVSTATPVPRMEAPATGSNGAIVLRSVCDPAFRSAHLSRRSRAAIERDYVALRRAG